MKKILTTGILAHVDAGKTTLSEALLYKSNTIRNLGSVDSKDTVLDFDETEKRRGITIYSSQANLETDDLKLTILDTPGHTDFSSETERTISVLDLAIVVISGTDGVQSHTRTIIELLKRNEVPILFFINKMDIANNSREFILDDIKKNLLIEPLDMTDDESWVENAVSLDDKMLEKYLETESYDVEDIESLIRARKAAAVVFGSARQLEGVDRLLSLVGTFYGHRAYSEEFGARVYKIGRDESGKRLSFLKVTGGELSVRDEVLPGEKIDEIRIYTGPKFGTVKTLKAGEVAAVTGLSTTYPGMGLGEEKDGMEPILKPVISYKVEAKDDVSSHTLLVALKEIEESEPSLEVDYEVRTDEIKVSLMGAIQREVLESRLLEEYKIRAVFSQSDVLYKETIISETYGHGHFEPLRHYADVKIKMIPGERGSGISVKSEVSTDVLEINYQHQIERKLRSRLYGILADKPLTDVIFIITDGKSHKKHTEGGDFSKATLIAVRDALIHGESAIMEPYYDVIIKVPLDKTGRAMTDIEKMHGQVLEQKMDNEFCIIDGKIPVNEFMDYDATVRSYTGGLGQISVEPGGYDICHNGDSIIEECNYDYRVDPRNPYESIYVHGRPEDENTVIENRNVRGFETSTYDENEYKGMYALDKELEEIFVRTYGEIKRYRDPIIYTPEKEKGVSDPKYDKKEKVDHERYVFIDGYNVINSWKDLKELAAINLDGARGKLEDIVSNYQGYTGFHITIVYDAYRLKGYTGSRQKMNNIEVAFTKQDEKADQYIEREVTRLCAKKKNVTVVTSDGWVQKMVLGSGALRMSSREFELEIERVKI
ncbi:MAG: TetM/TetW/TetO/TetS family tetracycline resistance ribosomal protection protein [Lachnospiraceae bacterium]|nr:TetM/TetW/TetO/TetS family tetracycline resistance ribosomal protection protein [Lachnospiraceae bacterium]